MKHSLLFLKMKLSEPPQKLLLQMFLHLTSLKYFFTLLLYVISASPWPISYIFMFYISMFFPRFLCSMSVLVTSSQECLLNWVNSWKYLWKLLLFLYPFPWDLGNIFSGQNAMSNLQSYNVHKYFCFCPHNFETLIPEKTQAGKYLALFPAKSGAKLFLLWLFFH